VTDEAAIARILSDCTRYWRETALSNGLITEMRDQLTVHLRESLAAGQSPDRVVGSDIAEFAESWAAEYRARMPRQAWTAVTRGEIATRRSAQRQLILYGLGISALVVAVAVSEGDNTVDNEIWRWLWTGLAIVMGIGEIFTAGFFLLPFAIGAAASAVLAWIGVSIMAQWFVFFGVSLVAMVYLRRFINRQDEVTPQSVGANRWANSRGIVLEAIDPLTSAGMVRIGGEEWRATSDQKIPAGSQVIVREVTGARLVVTPIES
jgi:membrane protein implicated in regulation of membrane protease activity